ncbi:MAG: phenylalanine--tRNA ligase subunit beta [Eggerthellaceae bacterium]|nr:phenylalanine--tRNA ligase subunit beta [Eggerthellaceae bacterium]
MRVSLNWLNEYVDVPSDLKEFCDRLDLTGTGVEGVEVLGDAFKNVVTGKIVSKKPHPDSDHMWVTTVDVGLCNLDENQKPAPLQIVCGAQNFEEGNHVVVAMIGAVLPGDFVIKKSKLRGVESCGMNCSARELGLGSDHSGIMILPDDAPIGIPFADYMKSSDTVLDLEITPNRPDCLSMVGMAREVGAMYRMPARNPLSSMKAKIDSSPKIKQANAPATVEIADANRCARYTACVIKGVKVGPSPKWLADRVIASGTRSINNIVDVTNYILYLFGQPLHSFDYDKLLSKDGVAHIIVRGARDNEKMTTLDGEDRVLSSDMTVISTPDGAVALAGVMGGMDSEVTEETTDILLEAATFNHSCTSRTSRNLGLISEASMRYERIVDDNPIADIAQAAAALIIEVAGGSLVTFDGNDIGLVDVYKEHTKPRDLTFRVKRFRSMMGEDIPQKDIEEILGLLGCEVGEGDKADILHVVAPTYRPDLEREIDLYEEVLRLFGMDKITPTLPGGRGRNASKSLRQEKLALLNDTLRASGLNETMTYSFARADDIDVLRLPKEGLGLAVELLNPLNADQGVMRQSIIPGLLRSVSYNQNRGVKNVALYEIGTVFFAHEGKKQPIERQKVAGVLAGSMHEVSWNRNDAPFDFFDGKGVLENIAREFAIPKIRFKEANGQDAPHLQPGRGAWMLSGGTVLGWVGEIHPEVAAAFDINASVVAFELDLDQLTAVSAPARPYTDVPVFPAMNMDVAFVVDEDITCEKLTQFIQSAAGKLLESVSLFDVYRDEKRLGKGKKSMAFALCYRAQDRTLTGEEVEAVHKKMIAKVCNACGGEVRA